MADRSEAPPKIIGRIASRAGEIRITCRHYDGYPLIDIRTWFQPKEGGDLRPGREGVSLKPGDAQAAIRFLQQALAETGKDG